MAERSIWSLFEVQYRRMSGASAVDSLTYSVSYEGLARRVDDLLSSFSAETVGDVVAGLVRSPLSAIICTLACSRLGVAFAPIDPAAPVARQREILEDCGASILITESVGGFDITRAGVAQYRTELQGISHVLYTSGSTGRPKGVLVSTEGLLERLEGLAVWPGFPDGGSFLAHSSASFDISLAEFFLPLLNGGRVVTYFDQRSVDLRDIGRVVAELEPDVVQATPSWWRVALAAGWSTSIPSIWCGGEALTRALAQKLQRHTEHLWNVYGPTEATVWASASLVIKDGPILLGHPIPGSELYVDTSVVAEDDEVGELIISGPGVTRGYLGRSDATHAAYVEFRGTRAYRTGDLVRIVGNSFEYVGRRDFQVKVNGFRVELLEVEAVLERHPLVIEACALLECRERLGEYVDRLVCAVSIRSRLSREELLNWCRKELPPYSVPAVVRFLPEMPHTVAGKIDRQAVLRGLVD